jgi:hypothetical protein
MRGWPDVARKSPPPAPEWFHITPPAPSPSARLEGRPSTYSFVSPSATTAASRLEIHAES